MTGDVLEFPPLDEEENSDEDVEGEEETSDETSEDIEKDEVADVEIDFNRIDERARLITPTRGGGYWAALSPDGKTFVYDGDPLGTPALWSVPFEGGDASKIDNIGDGLEDLQWSEDGKGVYYLSGGNVKFWKKDPGKVSNVKTYGRQTIDLTAERMQMIGETGRMLTTGFYDPNMHGVDWDAAVEYYAPLVEETSEPETVSLLMNMMFGELDGSHLSAYTASSTEGIGLNPGFLGMEFDPFTEGPGLLVAKVYARGPVDYTDTRIDVGEWILEINDVPVSTDINVWSLLDDTIARSTKLLVSSDQEGAETRVVTVGPVGSYDTATAVGSSQMRYLDWVESKREIVETESGGQIGYIHIPGMSGGPLEEFARELFSENFDKEALILDVRFNGGGNTHEQLLDILSRPQFGWAQGREERMIAQPGQRWDRPIVLLINQDSFSDAEIFPAGFKALGLGTIIGVPTHGGVIGTWTLPLVDGITQIRVPRHGWYTIECENMENLGIQPDIYVEQDLNHIRAGIDDQLESAIDYLLDKL